jgi:membrane protein CcdC involved in cytochrome C biogenesis
VTLFEPGTFLGWSIAKTSEETRPIHDRFEAISKWWLDVLPKVLMCAGLVYAAAKSESAALKLLAALTTGALFNYILMFFNRREIRYHHKALSPRVSFWLGIFMTLSVSLVLLWWLIQAFGALVELMPSIKKVVQ